MGKGELVILFSAFQRRRLFFIQLENQFSALLVIPDEAKGDPRTAYAELKLLKKHLVP